MDSNRPTELRAYADHVRYLARGILDKEAKKNLNEYADELDARASALEEETKR